MLNTVLLVVQVASSFGLILLVLLHAGKGGGLSDMFGGGGSLSSGTAMERRLDKFTVIIAVVFSVSTFMLSYLSAHQKL